jgi:LysM repeat protein
VKVAEFCRVNKAFGALNPSKYGHLQALLLEDARIYWGFENNVKASSRLRVRVNVQSLPLELPGGLYRVDPSCAVYLAGVLSRTSWCLRTRDQEKYQSIGRTLRNRIFRRLGGNRAVQLCWRDFMAQLDGGVGASRNDNHPLHQNLQNSGSVLKAKSPDVLSPKGAAPPNGTKVHQVKEGDTLQSIAHQHDVPVQKIYDHNRNLDPANLDVKPGQEQDHWSKEYLEDIDRVYVPLLARLEINQTGEALPAELDGGVRNIDIEKLLATPSSLATWAAQAFVAYGQVNATAAKATNDPDDQTLQLIAEGIVSGGDSQSKATAFSQEAAKLNDQDRARLLQLVTEMDKDATANWLNTETLTRAADEGKVTDGELAAVAETVAYASEFGYLESYESGSIIPTERDSTTQFMVDFTGRNYSGDYAQTLQNSVRVFGASDSAQVKGFIEDFATKSVQYAANVDLDGGGAQVNEAAYQATFGIHLLESVGSETQVAQVYAGLSKDGRQNLLDTLAITEKSFGFWTDSYDVSGSPGRSDDPVAIIINAVASQPSGAKAYLGYEGGGGPRFASESFGQIAVELAQYAETSPDGYFYNGDKPIDDRAEALGRLFANHTTPILDALTDGNIKGDPKEANADKIQLANLMRLTIGNENLDGAVGPRLTTKSAIERNIERYENKLEAKIENDDGNANSRLSLLTVAKLNVTAQAYFDGWEEKEGSASALQFGAQMLGEVISEVIPGDGVALGVLKGMGVNIAADGSNVDEAIRNWILGDGKDLKGQLERMQQLLNSDVFENLDNNVAAVAIRDALNTEVGNIIKAINDKNYDEYLHSDAY